MYAFQVEFDLCPGRGGQHLLPHQSDILEAGRDLLVVQLQPPALQVALCDCEAEKHSRNGGRLKAEQQMKGKKGGTEGAPRHFLSVILRFCVCVGLLEELQQP